METNKNITSHPKTENRLLLSLMLPILAEQILRSFMGTANTFMLSRISDEASAAVGVSNQILNVVIITATMIGSGASTLINQYLGAKKKREAAHIIMNSLMVSTLVGLFFSLAISALAAQILGLVGLEEGLINDAAIYLRIVGASCVIQFISSAISAYFRCYQKPVVAMLVIVCTNLMNLAGSWAVVSGMFAGQMMQGVGGIARVRLVSELIGLALSMMMLMRQDWDLQIVDMVRLKKEYVTQILRLGFMSGAEGICYYTAQLVTTGFITSFPSQVLSAKVYVQTVNNYTYLAGQSVGLASQIMTGHMIGAGEKDRAYGFVKKSWLYVLSCNICFSLLFFVCSRQIIGIFTDSEEILSIARMLFFIDIFTCLGRSLNHSFNLGLRSAGYVFWPMIIAASSIWTFQCGLGYLASIGLHLGIIGIWIAQTVDEWFRGLCAMRLWLGKKWMKMDVVKERREGEKE